MNTDLSSYRKSYEKQELLEKNVSDNPLEVFRKWFHEVDENFDVGETNAMTLSTIGVDGFPKSRVVLLKKFTDDGFIFYTNYSFLPPIINNSLTIISETYLLFPSLSS